MLAAPPSPARRVDERTADQRAAAMLVQGMVERENCRRSLLYYLERYAYTVDEHDREQPIRPLLHGDHAVDRETLQLLRELDGREDDYLRYTAGVWEQEKLLGLPKTRQMRLSHLMVHCHGWLAMFYPGQRIAFQSRKEEDADALLERVHQGWLHMVKVNPHVPWPGWKRTSGRIVFPHGSLIRAVAQGPDVFRSYTFSAILADEVAFQEKAEEAFTAALPTIEGGDAKYTAVSSASPGFFQSLCYDKLQAD